jgi:hypothetical protein
MLVPVMLYDLKVGTSADDEKAVLVCTARSAAKADEVARTLMRARDAFEGAPEFFVKPRTASVEAESAEAVRAAGLEVRFVLAPVTPPEGIAVVPAPVEADSEPAEEAP